jgi:hypothetical protein
MLSICHHANPEKAIQKYGTKISSNLKFFLTIKKKIKNKKNIKEEKTND